MRSRGWVVAGQLLSLLAMILLPQLALGAELREAVEQLAEHLANSVPEGRTLRVAVTDFPDLEEVTSNLGRYIGERLTTRLSTQPQTFRVIERRRLTKVLGELRFSMSDLIDPNKAKQLGKMLGVEAIVVGTVSDLGSVVEVDARIIEIETNNILPGVTASIDKNDTLKKMMAEGRVRPATPRGGGVAVASTPSEDAPPISSREIKYQEFSNFRVEVEALQSGERGEIVIFLNYINKGVNEFKIGLVDPFQKTFLIDNLGNRYTYRSSSGIGYVSGLGHLDQLMTLGPDQKASTSFTFGALREIERKGSFFSFNSEQGTIRQTIDSTWGYTRNTVQGRFNITIHNIEPR